MEVEFSIHQAKNIPDKFSNAVFAEYQWIDDRATLFETDRIRSKKKDRNPLFNYKRVHDCPIDNYIIENLSDTTCIISIYGKLTEENMEGLYKDFTARPETAQLVFGKQESANMNEPFYNAAFGHKVKQDVMILEENAENEESPNKSKKKQKQLDKQKAREQEEKENKKKEKELEKLKKEMEKLHQQNDKLKEDINVISKGGKAGGSGCCTIF